MRVCTYRWWLAVAIAEVVALTGIPNRNLLAECMTDVYLTTAIVSDSLHAGWTEEEAPGETWVAVLRIEEASWMADSTLATKGYGEAARRLVRRRFRAEPMAVLMGKMSPDTLSLTSGRLRDPSSGSIILHAESFEPEVGDTLVQVSTPRMSGMPWVSLCTSAPVRRGYVMGVPLATILARPGVALQRPAGSDATR